ncbi:transposable element Tcb1 transposase [Trichonephila clavipes]|nr:transposable element Tcb1 transposase [Trichonephila clavipes]
MKEGCWWRNGMKLSLLTSHASVCNTTNVGFETGDTVVRGCVIHRHSGLEQGIMLWGVIGYHSRTPLVRIAAATPDQLCQRVEAAWSAVPQEHIQSLFESIPRRVAAVISNNCDYSGY